MIINHRDYLKSINIYLQCFFSSCAAHISLRFTSLTFSASFSCRTSKSLSLSLTRSFCILKHLKTLKLINKTFTISLTDSWARVWEVRSPVHQRRWWIRARLRCYFPFWPWRLFLEQKLRKRFELVYRKQKKKSW